MSHGWKMILHDIIVPFSYFFIVSRWYSSYFTYLSLTDCELYAIGKPVFHKFSEEYYGSALKDPVPRNDVFAEKYWCTKQNDSYRLYEYANKAAYRNNAHTKTYRLEHPFRVSLEIILFIHYKSLTCLTLRKKVINCKAVNFWNKSFDSSCQSEILFWRFTFVRMLFWVTFHK